MPTLRDPKITNVHGFIRNKQDNKQVLSMLQALFTSSRRRVYYFILNEKTCYEKT